MSNDKTPEEPSTRWRDKVKNSKPTFEDHNKHGLGKSKSDLKPASTAPPVDNKQAPKVEAKPKEHTARVEPPKTPVAKVEKKPEKFVERVKPKTPPTTPPKGPRK
ncbi:hypothetical protein GCM10028806_56670 [Spirosoma terrae]|uniref:Uncharacterized protein n=1 Tax=Spirosoma terrae TaxID=1968276 RepID=A0A6L9LIL4_9BACT|nr:hypothetical protein [Spirosoma terrae]NDU99242.1 hypothetical protein [Spirosoma terrae]